jgi:small subunit ribosomal protein S1
VVLDIDPDKQRVSLGVKQLSEDPWVRAIPEKYIPGHIVKGKVTKLTNFGAFVQLESDLEGLLHISELSDQKIKKPQDVVKVGDELEVKILKVDTEARKIGLSLRRAQWAAEEHTGSSTGSTPSTALGTGALTTGEIGTVGTGEAGAASATAEPAASGQAETGQAASQQQTTSLTDEQKQPPQEDADIGGQQPPIV